MKTEKIAAYAEIISSIAIVLTLIYLAVQTQQMSDQTAQMAVQTEQTNNILLSNSRQATLEGDLAILELIADHPEYAQLSRISDRELTEVEFEQLNTIMASFVRIREFSYRQYKAGILDEETWESYLSIFINELQKPQSVLWWEQTRRVMPTDFVSEVERRLEAEH